MYFHEDTTKGEEKEEEWRREGRSILVLECFSIVNVTKSLSPLAVRKGEARE